MQALTAAFAAGGPIAKIEKFNLVCVPGLADAKAIAMLQVDAVARRAFLIADCEESATVANVAPSLPASSGANAINSALVLSLGACAGPAAGQRAARVSAFRLRRGRLCPNRCQARRLEGAGRH